MKRNWLVVAGLAGLLAMTLSQTAGAQAQYVIREVMSGLFNPRHLTFGPDGGLYVAEAGVGGDGPGMESGDGQTVFYGPTSSVSRLLNGVQERILTGLPSLAPTGGGGATGLHGIVFNSSGQAFGLFGLGAAPGLRDPLGAVGENFARLVTLPLNGGSLTSFADLAAHEAANNPDGNLLDTNPYGLAITPGGSFLVADAGANALLGVATDGTVSTLAVLPNQPNPLGFGPPFYQGVPTSVAIGPDGAYYLGQLTGFPFPPGAANIYRYDPATGDFTTAYSGFTNVVDLAFGPDGSLYVLEISRDGLASQTGPVPGALIRVDPITGEYSTIASDGLVFPTGVTVGQDGAIYVTNFGVIPGAGQVLQITAVPEPGVCALLGAGLFGGALLARRRRR